MNKKNYLIFERYSKSFLLITIVLVFIIIECTLKYAFNISLPHSYTYPRHELFHHILPANSETLFEFKYSPELKQRIIQTNQYSMRFSKINSKFTKRVLNLGDSFIEAKELPYEMTFNHLLNQYFDKKIEFISHGVASWSPTLYFSWIYHMYDTLKFDEVNIFLFFNDFLPSALYIASDETYRSQAIYKDGIPIKYQFPEKNIGQLLFRLIRKNSSLVSLIYNNILKLNFKYKKQYQDDFFSLFQTNYKRPKISSIDLKTYIRAFEDPSHLWPPIVKHNVDTTLKVVTEIHRFLRLKNVKLNILFIPSGFNWQNEIKKGKRLKPWNIKANESISERGLRTYIENYLKMNNVNFIPLFNIFNSYKVKADQLIYFQSDGHLNQRGHKLLFNALKDIY